MNNNDNGFFTANKGKKEIKVPKGLGKKLLIALAAVVVIGTVLSSMHQVPAGHTGVVTQFGAVQETVLSEGLHFTAPFITNVVTIDNRVLKAEVDCSSASKDLQTVSSTISVNYRIAPTKSAEVYKNIGSSYQEVIVIPAIQETVKAITAKYTAEELITERQSVGDQMRDLLSEKISSYGFNIEVFNVINFDFSAEFNAAIEAKQTAQQNALKAEQDLARIKIEGEQKIEQAKAEAEAYRLKSAEITDKMIQMEIVNKWNGELPKVVTDGTPIFSIEGIVGGNSSSGQSGN